MSSKFMLKGANREILPQSGNLSWQRLDRRLDHGIPFNWHHHPEMELTLTLNCTGQRFVGDNVASFGDGDLALVGANLPHTWASQTRIDPSKPFAAKVIWFTRDWLVKIGQSAPEFLPLVPFCARAQRGLQFTEPARLRARPLIEKLFNGDQRAGITTLLDLLLVLARDEDAAHLSTTKVLHKIDAYSKRIDRVLDHLHQNYERPVPVDELAEIAALSASGLHRMFKRHLGAGLSDYLINLRIGEACARLAATDMPIGVISQDVGYASQANFNRHFLRLRGETPRAYRKRILASKPT